MSERITTLLDLVRLETGAIQPRFDPYELAELVGSVLHRLDARLRAHRVRIELPENLPLLQVDGRLIEQVLENLLDNASKYTPAGSEIRISARALTRQVRSASRTTVRDCREAIRKSCSRNSSAALPKASDGGIGLGLAICRTIVRLHNGRIWAENRAPHGAAFRFSVPQSDEPLSIRTSGCARTMTVASRAVLIVEDDPQIRRVLRTLLELEQFRIIEAETAALGLMRSAHLQARSDHRRSGTTRSRWHGDHHRRARLVAGTDHRAVGAQRRGRQGRGARGRCR